MSKNARVLVTGATGFIGANLVRKLIEKEFEVHSIQKKESKSWRLDGISESFHVYHQSLLDRDGLTKLLHEISPSAIFHLAAHGSYSSQTDVDEMISVNIQGTFNLLMASREIPYTCFVNTGSSSEYGVNDSSMNEEDICKPFSFYAATKLSATVLGQVFSKKYDKPVITLRPFSVYGPYEEKSRFISTIILSLIKGIPIKITPGDVRRDFVYIDDIVDAYCNMISNGDKLKGQIVNIGTGLEYTNDEVVKKLFEITQKNVPVQKGGFSPRDWDMVHWKADITKAKNHLNWQPKNSLEEGLLKTYSWFEKNVNLYE